MTGLTLQVLLLSLQISFALIAWACAAGNTVSRELLYPIFLYLSGVCGGAGIAFGLMRW